MSKWQESDGGKVTMFNIRDRVRLCKDKWVNTRPSYTIPKGTEGTVLFSNKEDGWETGIARVQFDGFSRDIYIEFYNLEKLND